jgi:hypothetical protein
MFDVQSESVTLSVDYLISSTQVGLTSCLGFLCPEFSSTPLDYLLSFQSMPSEVCMKKEQYLGSESPFVFFWEPTAFKTV